MSSIQQTPDQNSPESATAIADAPAAEPQENRPSFAERVGKKQWKPAPDPFGLVTDYQVGVRLFESKKDRQMAIMFGDGRPEDKPSQAVIDLLKEAGYRWNPTNKIWAHPVRSGTAATTRIEAYRLHNEICAMIRAEQGISSGPEIPF